MHLPVSSLHHVTAIAREPLPNYHFYGQVLGQRLVKQTVHPDDPSTLHLFYGDYAGTPGTLLTFLSWPYVLAGTPGAGQADTVQYAIREETLDFWLRRCREHKVVHQRPVRRFRETCISFLDPHGLSPELVTCPGNPSSGASPPAGVPAESAITGLYRVTLLLAACQATEELLTGVFGYALRTEHENRYRFQLPAVTGAALVDVLVVPAGLRGRVGVGSVHHVAFRVGNEEAQQRLGAEIAALGYTVTPVIDRVYFRSIYFRKPGGVLLEIATERPGFTVDEPPETLGSQLQLPARLEHLRKQLAATLLPGLPYSEELAACPAGQ